MDRQQVNRICGIAPIVMSLAAFFLLIVAMMTGFERGERDEGATAHIFQLLIVAQAPFILVFLATANWRRFLPVARYLVLEALSLTLALGPVAYFRL